MNKIWSESELNILKEFYPIYGINYCCEKLGRSSASVRGKAFNLNMSAPGSKLFTHEQYENQLLDKEVTSYPIEQYITHKTPILHACIEGHEWKAQPHNILNGHGCPICNYSGFRVDIPAKVYYVKITSQENVFYKIGVTNRTVRERFKAEQHLDISLIKEWNFATGNEALAKEKEMHAQYKANRIHKIGLLKYGGNTELFISDVMGLDV